MNKTVRVFISLFLIAVLAGMTRGGLQTAGPLLTDNSDVVLTTVLGDNLVE